MDENSEESSEETTKGEEETKHTNEQQIGMREGRRSSVVIPRARGIIMATLIRLQDMAKTVRKEVEVMDVAMNQGSKKCRNRSGREEKEDCHSSGSTSDVEETLAVSCSSASLFEQCIHARKEPLHKVMPGADSTKITVGRCNGANRQITSMPVLQQRATSSPRQAMGSSPRTCCQPTAARRDGCPYSRSNTKCPALQKKLQCCSSGSSEVCCSPESNSSELLGKYCPARGQPSGTGAVCEDKKMAERRAARTAFRKETANYVKRLLKMLDDVEIGKEELEAKEFAGALCPGGGGAFCRAPCARHAEATKRPDNINQREDIACSCGPCCSSKEEGETK